MQKDKLYRSDALPLRYMPDFVRPMNTKIRNRHVRDVLIPLKFLIIIGSSSIAVFLQLKPGRNYFGFRHLVGGMLAMGVYFFFVRAFSDEDSTAFLMFMSVFFGVGLSWCSMSLWKLIRNVPAVTTDWGSYWFIWNWLPFSKNPYWIYAFVLPIFTLSVSAWIDDWTLRTWLIIASIALLLRTNINAFFLQRAKEQITNSTAQWETVSGSSSGQAGTAMPSAKHIATSPHVEQPTIDTALGNLDPNLQSLIDKD